MADIHQTGIVTHAVARRRALRTIGIFEAAKGIAAMAGTVGLLRLVHHDIRVQLADIIEHLGMRPNSHYPAILLRYADLLHNADQMAAAVGGTSGNRLCHATLFRIVRTMA